MNCDETAVAEDEEGGEPALHRRLRRELNALRSVRHRMELILLLEPVGLAEAAADRNSSLH